VKPIRALIIDDEPLAREGIKELLNAEADIKVVGECGDGVQAIKAIQTDAPDLIFLDVQMPEIDGFGVLERIAQTKIPVVIFVTAFDEYALRAFDAHALDYLLKPLDPDRFAIALGRAREMIELNNNGGLPKKLAAFLHDLKTPTRHLDRIMVKSSDHIYFVKCKTIDWIEANGDYVYLHVRGEKHLVREKMSELEQNLDPHQFARIHRSTIVNIDRIEELRPMFYGEYAVVLNDGRKLTLSRTYRGRLFGLLNQST